MVNPYKKFLHRCGRFNLNSEHQFLFFIFIQLHFAHIRAAAHFYITVGHGVERNLGV